jgi:hypothetical protein
VIQLVIRRRRRIQRGMASSAADGVVEAALSAM